jgi:hypothetical protein
MKPQGHVPTVAPAPTHEEADLNVPLILRVVAVVVPVLAVLIVAVAVLFHLFNHAYAHRTSQAAPVVTAADLPPAPRLQTDPAGDLQAVRAKEDAHLEHYAWVDRAQGIAQVPIDRAMVLWTKSYVSSPPTAPLPTTNAAAAPTELQMRQDKAEETSHAP